MAKLTRTLHVIGDGWAKDAVVHLDANYQPQTLDLDATSIARLGLDRFTLEITHRTGITPRETIDAVLAASSCFASLSDILVNKPGVVAPYELWRVTVHTNAQHIGNLIAARAAKVWNWHDMLPGELLDSGDQDVPTSVAYARFSQWGTNQDYIKDALYSTGDPSGSDRVRPGETGYRAPGTGPYYKPWNAA